MKKLVRRKASGKKIEAAEPEEKESNVVDLIEPKPRPACPAS